MAKIYNLDEYRNKRRKSKATLWESIWGFSLVGVLAIAAGLTYFLMGDSRDL
jgi:Tfp pilus assembly protein PilN